MTELTTKILGIKSEGANIIIRLKDFEYPRAIVSKACIVPMKELSGAKDFKSLIGMEISVLFIYNNEVHAIGFTKGKRLSDDKCWYRLKDGKYLTNKELYQFKF